MDNVSPASDNCADAILALKDQRTAPVASDETEAWLIEWERDRDGNPGRRVFLHNCVSDYRTICEGVTVTELVRRSPQPTAAPVREQDKRDAALVVKEKA